MMAACVGAELGKGLRMKRYVESQRWNDPWFRKLTGRNKLAWLFISQTSNACGVVKVDLELWSFTLGIGNMDWEGFFKAIEERIVRLPGGDIWIPQVVADHYGPLSRECRYHLPVIAFLHRHDLIDHPEIIWKKEFAAELKGSEPLTKGCQPYPKGSEPLENNDFGGLGSDDTKAKKGKRFIKPTVEDIAHYCEERNNNLDPNQIFDHYEACGWVQGRAGKPIRDWRAAVRTWEGKRFSDSVIPFQAGRLDVDPVTEAKRIDQSVAEDRKRRRELEQYNGPGILAELRGARQTQG